jgi:2-(1,2-epoxy-1,2-dihydrophenyl)acetyl-CoA isomerase
MAPEEMLEARMDETSVLVEVSDGYRVLTLNRPDKLNSFTGAMHRALKAALDEAEADKACKAVLITGAGRGFCAGQDLADPEIQPMPGDPPDLGETLEKTYNPLIRQLRALPMPIVCAVNGIAAGAGVSLALAADVTLAARAASFGQAFVKIGLIPDSGATAMLPRLIGPARARAWALTGETIKADTAEAWGLVWKVVEDDELISAARTLCSRFAASSPAGLDAIKRAFEHAADSSLDAQLDYERDEQRRLGRGRDYEEGVAAFMEKRKPVFGGRP